MTDNVIQLFTKGEVQSQDKKFTRLVGGFGEDKPMITTKQIGELMGLQTSIVNRTITRNIAHFEDELDILDLKSVMPQWHSKIGYSKNAYNASKNIYALSRSGFLLYLKFAEGSKAVELYKDFLEDYFQTKAENESMKKSIEQTLEELKEEKAFLLGKAIMSVSDADKVEFMQLAEKKTNQIIELEKSMSEKDIVEKLSSKLTLAEMIENSKSNYDVDSFSKILNIKGLGRNNMFKWMKENKMLMSNNKPYQHYMIYFSVIPVTKNGYTNYKPLIKPNGVDYLMKRLIKAGKVITKSVEDVLKELEGLEKAN